MSHDSMDHFSEEFLRGPSLTQKDFLQAFEETANYFPDKIAVICGNSSLTYAALNSRANQLGQYLQKKGVAAEKAVVVYLDRSIEMTIAFFGILKAGGTYVPFDPQFTPLPRLSHMVNMVHPFLILTTSYWKSHFSDHAQSFLILDNEWFQGNLESTKDLDQHCHPENLAYIMHTSGSTGTPRGVMVSRANLSHCAQAMQLPMSISSRDVYLHTASFAFSSSIRQLTVPLVCGATIVLATTNHMRDPYELFVLVQQQNVTIMDLVPSFWSSSLETLKSLGVNDLRNLMSNNLRLILSASEALPNEIPHRWRSELNNSVDLINMYGQTETTGIVLTWPLKKMKEHENGGLVPIGTPIGNTQVVVLTRDLHPAERGIVGNIHITGNGLARGYVGQPEMTAERFVPDLWNNRVGSRMYFTGDRGLYHSDECIQYHGRIDSQVKVRGHRVELGELELHIRRYAHGVDSIVVPRTEENGSTELVAYVVSPSEQKLSNSEILDYLRQNLPYYMIPADIVFLDQLPLTSTGKVDRGALLQFQSQKSPLPQTCQVPQSMWEIRIAEIWKGVLKMETLQVHDNFFELGGQSLRAIQVTNLIHKNYNIHIPIQLIFDYPTVARLAKMIEDTYAVENELR